jgi:hypothetical protein
MVAGLVGSPAFRISADSKTVARLRCSGNEVMRCSSVVLRHRKSLALLWMQPILKLKFIILFRDFFLLDVHF